MQHHKYKLTEIENMMPFERQVYVSLLMQYLDQVKKEQEAAQKVMASGTVAYTDTRNNKDYLGTIASQIGRRLKQGKDMAASRDCGFAAQKQKNKILHLQRTRCWKRVQEEVSLVQDLAC